MANKMNFEMLQTILSQKEEKFQSRVKTLSGINNENLILFFTLIGEALFRIF